MLTTRRRFASARRFCASSSPASMRLASATSSSAVSRGTRPISLRYMRTGSSMLTPSGTERSISTSSSDLSRSTSSSFELSCESSTISMPRLLKVSYMVSISSGVRSCFCSASMSSPYVRVPPFFLPLARRFSTISELRLLPAALAVFDSAIRLPPFHTFHPSFTK